MMTKEDVEEWQRDIRKADETHPNSFANGPLIRALFRTTQELSSVDQQMLYLTKAVEGSNNALNRFIKVVKESGESSSKLGNRLLWLNVILAAATAVGAIATVIMAFKP